MPQTGVSVETLTERKLEDNDEVQQGQCRHSQSFSCLPALYISPAEISLSFPGNTLFAIAGVRAVTKLSAAAGCLLLMMERTTVVIQGLLCFVDP